MPSYLRRQEDEVWLCETASIRGRAKRKVKLRDLVLTASSAQVQRSRRQRQQKKNRRVFTHHFPFSAWVAPQYISRAPLPAYLLAIVKSSLSALGAQTTFSRLLFSKHHSSSTSFGPFRSVGQLKLAARNRRTWRSSWTIVLKAKAKAKAKAKGTPDGESRQ